MNFLNYILDTWLLQQIATDCFVQTALKGTGRIVSRRLYSVATKIHVNSYLQKTVNNTIMPLSGSLEQLNDLKASSFMTEEIVSVCLVFEYK